MKKKFFVALFLIMVCTPYLLDYMMSSFLDKTNHENRILAGWPVLSLSNLFEYPKQIETYINDHLPFKNELVKSYNIIEIAALHSSTSEKVILGKNGWLFYKCVSDGNPIAQYRGMLMLSEEELQLIAKNVIRTKENLAAEGREYIIFIAPNKERMYSEYMPDHYGIPAENYPVKQIVAYLKANTDVTVVYPYEALIKEKKRLGNRYNLYFKTDTHWNELGAYIGTKELLHVLGIDLPPLDSLNIQLNESFTSPGDLANMLNIGAFTGSEKRYSISGYTSQQLKKLSQSDYKYESNRVNCKKIFINGDSFYSAMDPVITTQFCSSTMVPYDKFNANDIQAKDTDIFVLETVERYAQYKLSNFIYTGGARSINK